MALHIDEEVQGYLDRGWFPYEDDTYALMLDKRQRAFYTRALVMWEQSGCRYFSRQQIEKLMTETGYQSPANALAAFIRNGVFHEVELVEGHMLYALSAFPFKQRNDRDAEMKVWQMSKNHGISRAGTIWCFPEDIEPVNISSTEAALYEEFLREVENNGFPDRRYKDVILRILHHLRCSDERAAEKKFQDLAGLGKGIFYQPRSGDLVTILVRPYKVGEGGKVIIPAMCQKVPKVEVDEPSVQEPELAPEQEAPACPEVDMDEVEIAPDPEEAVEYEIPNLTEELQALERKMEELGALIKQDARAVLLEDPFVAIDTLLNVNMHGGGEMKKRAAAVREAQAGYLRMRSCLNELRTRSADVRLKICALREE